MLRGGAWGSNLKLYFPLLDMVLAQMSSEMVMAHLVLVAGSEESGYENANNAPVASNDVNLTNENESVTVEVLSNDSDTDGDLLTITNLAAVVGGSASIVESSTKIMVTPSLDSTLPVSLTYMVSDGNGATATANLTVHVRQSNQFYNLISRTYGGSVTDSASSIVQTTDGFYVGGYASSSGGDVTSNSGGKDFV